MRLFFLHLQKCGGTTLIAFLDQMFATEDIAPYNHFGSREIRLKPSLMEPQLAEAKSYQFLRGHFPYSVFEMIRDDHLTLTMLRSPLERVVSFYNHWVRASKGVHPNETSDTLSLKKCISELSMDEFLQCEHPWVRSLFNNGQTRHLGGLPFSDDPTPLLLERALKNLDAFDLVTISERYDDSLQLICSRCGFLPPEKIQILNVGEHVATVDTLAPSTLHILREMTQYDEILYSRALEIFEHQYSEIGVRSVNVATSKPTKHFQATMEQSLRGIGWHAREGATETEFLRWTGPSCESTVYINLKKGFNYQFRLGIYGGMSSHIINNSKVIANGVEHHLKVEDDIATVHGTPQKMLTADISSDQIASRGETIFKIVVPETESHHGQDSSVDDKRQKGLLVRSIQVNTIASSQHPWFRFWPRKKSA
ncbi:MAG: hypothetical protein COA78_19565 [Blastopirellula sp.]|nr:MAG: hypothetical protein COA78_19565 [Blastopirellula sp.]